MSTVAELRTLLFATYSQVKPKDFDSNSLEPARVNTFITVATELCYRHKTKLDVFSLYDHAIVTLAAHLYTEALPGETNSGIITEEEDTSGKRVKYHTPSVKSLDNLSATKYGRIFSGIMQMIDGQYNSDRALLV